MLYVLILIYSPFVLVAEPRADMVQCAADAKSSIGMTLEGAMVDVGFSPVPKVVLAFCALGATTAEAGK